MSPSEQPAVRVALVTGAARGIGRATAQRLAAAGMKVGIGDVDADLVGATAAEVGVRGAALDVTSTESWQEFLSAMADLGPVDVLVNNAGIMPIGSVLKEDEATTRNVLEVNTHGVIRGTKAVAPGMVERGHGHVVNVASAVGRVATADGATYTASKFAVVGFSEAARKELGPLGVEVSLVMPTVVRTELAAGIRQARGVKEVGPEDVAEVVELMIRSPRPEMWVPRWTQPMSRITTSLPQGVQRFMTERFDADVLAQRDDAARAAYEARVRGSAAER
jgi:NADP-dependent 3-hydroxy acid dehydrogenase YdfG